jgi:hypothetical protein
VVIVPVLLGSQGSAAAGKAGRVSAAGSIAELAEKC